MAQGRETWWRHVSAATRGTGWFERCRPPGVHDEVPSPAIARRPGRERPPRRRVHGRRRVGRHRHRRHRPGPHARRRRRRPGARWLWRLDGQRPAAVRGHPHAQARDLGRREPPGGQLRAVSGAAARPSGHLRHVPDLPLLRRRPAGPHRPGGPRRAGRPPGPPARPSPAPPAGRSRLGRTDHHRAEPHPVDAAAGRRRARSRRRRPAHGPARRAGRRPAQPVHGELLRGGRPRHGGIPALRLPGIASPLRLLVRAEEQAGAAYRRRPAHAADVHHQRRPLRHPRCRQLPRRVGDDRRPRRPRLPGSRRRGQPARPRRLGHLRARRLPDRDEHVGRRLDGAQGGDLRLLRRLLR